MPPRKHVTETPAVEPDARPQIWVIVPTYNERDNVGPISAAILETIPGAHVLVVDDGSPDAQGSWPTSWPQNPAIAVLHRQSKQGLGRAYVAGFADVLARDADIVIQIDADFSHPVRSCRPCWSRFSRAGRTSSSGPAISRAATSRAGTSCGD